MTIPLSKSKRNLLLPVDLANSRRFLVGFVHREAEDEEALHAVTKPARNAAERFNHRGAAVRRPSFPAREKRQGEPVLFSPCTLISLRGPPLAGGAAGIKFRGCYKTRILPIPRRLADR